MLVPIWAVFTTACIAIGVIMYTEGAHKSLMVLIAFYIIVSFIIFRLIYKLSFFRDLGYIRLRREIKKIVRKFTKAKISKVLLYNYEEKMPGITGKVPTHYVVVFYCKKPDADDFKTHAINLHTMRNDPLREQALGLEASFRGVYKKPTQQDYLNEWQFCVLEKHEKPINIDATIYWRIWPRIEL
jgi:hypothetical protein